LLINCKKTREEGGREERGDGERRKREEKKARNKLFFKKFPVILPSRD